MKYDVTYSCGHTGTVQIYGTAAERESLNKIAKKACLPKRYDKPFCLIGY
mgnify:CR=1 FL=1